MGTGRGLVLALVVVAIAVTGCGGSGGGESISISKEEFIAKADAICKKSNERMEAGFGKVLAGSPNLAKLSSAQERKLVDDVMVPNLKREVAALRELGVPDGDGERVDAMLEALEEGVETAEQDPQAVAKSSDAVFGIASRIAGEYGLEVCGSR